MIMTMPMTGVDDDNDDDSGDDNNVSGRPRALAHIAQKVDIIRNKLIFSGEVHECVLNH